MNELRVDIGGSTRGFEDATERTKRIAREAQQAIEGQYTPASFRQRANANEKYGFLWDGASAANAAKAGDAVDGIHVKASKLKKVFHELKEISPLLGYAVQAAFSPIGAVIALTVTALSDYRSAMAKSAEEAKKAAQESRDAWMDSLEAIHSKDPTKAFGDNAKKQSSRSARESGGGFDVRDETEEGYAEGIGFLGQMRKALFDFMDLTGGTKFAGNKTRSEDEDELRSMREQAARGTAASALKRGKHLEDKEAAAKTNAADLKERETLQERLEDMQQKSYLDSLSKEQQINELHQRRLEFAQMMAQHWDKMTDVNRLKAQIELEKLTGEEALKRRELKPVGLVAKEAVHVDSLSSMGMFTSVGAVTNPLVDVGRQQLAKLDELVEIARGGQDIYAP